MSERKADGKFEVGNKAAVGHGRPSRAIEGDYMRALSDALTLEDWGAIVVRAVADAKAGDGKAREFLARHALGESPLSLSALALRDVLGVSPADEVAEAADMERASGDMTWSDGTTALERARRIASKRVGS